MALIRRTRGSLPVGYDPLNDDDEDPVRICYTTIARRMQDQFDGRILRRTVTSLDWEGNPLIKLEPYQTVTVMLRLEKREMEILEHLAAKVRKTSAHFHWPSRKSDSSLLVYPIPTASLVSSPMVFTWSIVKASAFLVRTERRLSQHSSLWMIGRRLSPPNSTSAPNSSHIYSSMTTPLKSRFTTDRSFSQKFRASSESTRSRTTRF